MSKKQTIKEKLIYYSVPIILIAAILIGGGVIGGYYLFRTTDNTVVGSVNGYDIYAGELSDQMARDRSEVMTYFESKYNATVDGDFWNTEFDGTTPMDYLRDYSMEKVKKYKLQMGLAVKYGLRKKSEISYEYMQEALEKENIERSSKVAAGQPIYGPQAYSNDTYYEYILSNLIIKLKEHMSVEGEPLYTTDEGYKAYYEEIKDVAYILQDDADFDVYEITFKGAGNDSAIPEEKAVEIMDDVYEILKKSGSPKDAKALVKDEHPEVNQRKYHFSEDEASAVYKSSPNIFQQMASLKTGTFCEPTVDQMSIRIVYCKTRKKAGYKPFKEYKSSVISSYNDKYYDIYINDLCNQYKVETNDNYYKIEI